MTILSIIFLSISLGIFIYAILRTVLIINTRAKMEAKEKELLNKGVSPYGSALSHGMVFNKDTNKIESDHKQSITWYKRLIA